MRVGTRITATTSAIVAVALAAYAFFNLRSVHDERRARLRQEAREQALNLRALVEGIGVEHALRTPGVMSARLEQARSRWRVSLLDIDTLSQKVSSEAEPRDDRLRKLIQLRLAELFFESEDTLFYLIPLRIPSPIPPDGFKVVGAIELSRDTAFLGQWLRNDLLRTIATLGLITGMLILVIMLTTRLLVVQPITKLISGIDDVAQGDLSRVLLSQRDDEIGALATRFNTMTFSLRESRAETERQNQAKLGLEQRLSHTEKMATIGQLAAEIAHEVGTPLNVISGRARNLAKKSAGDTTIEKNATIIAEQASRIARIIQRLLDFTRRKIGTIEPSEVNLNEITLSTMEFLEGQFTKANVKSTLSRAEGLPPVMGDRDRLQQVFLNLFLNAIEAMPRGGVLLVETSTVERKRPGLETTPSQRYVVVDVIDTGVGIPAAAREKIFEPFYTSKDREGGTGLGLAVCHGIVKEHDGWIEIADATGGGTIFRIFLPARP
jgi:signal transduction histidine kinase